MWSRELTPRGESKLSMKRDYIRPLAICVFMNNGRILVAEGYSPPERPVYYRPLGGTIIPGEYSADAIAREIKEELNAEIADSYLLGVIENIFTFEGNLGHEIVMVYDARFVDRTFYEQEEFQGVEDASEPFKAIWKPLDWFGPDGPPLYPDGLMELLLKHRTENTQ